jgi:hypothetical protein
MSSVRPPATCVKYQSSDGYQANEGSEDAGETAFVAAMASRRCYRRCRRRRCGHEMPASGGQTAALQTVRCAPVEEQHIEGRRTGERVSSRCPPLLHRYRRRPAVVVLPRSHRAAGAAAEERYHTRPHPQSRRRKPRRIRRRGNRASSGRGTRRGAHGHDAAVRKRRKRLKSVDTLEPDAGRLTSATQVSGHP